MIMSDAFRKGFLIDLEGALLERGQPAAGAQELVQHLQLSHQPHRFISDQRYGSAKELGVRLRRLGFRLDEARVFTSATATARFLARQEPGGTAFVIGDGGMVQALQRAGFAVDDQNPDYVVVAEGDALSMSLLQRAVNLVRSGAKLIAASLDPSVATRDGIAPGSGAIVSALETATGRKALSLGRMSPVTVCEAARDLTTAANHTVLITDKMDPDVLTGLQLGVITVLVLGAYTLGELKALPYKPTLIVKSLAELLGHELLQAPAA
jgi:NagD protein